MSRNEATALVLGVCLGLTACEKTPSEPEPPTPQAAEAVALAAPRASYTIVNMSKQVAFPLGINTAGQVVGYFNASPGAFASTAFIWQNGVFRNIATLGGSFNRAFAINTAGQVVGWSERSDGAVHAFLWQNGTPVRDLGTLGWTTGASFEFASAATGINSKTQIVGSSLTAAGDLRAFIWEAGRMRRLTGLENVVGRANGIDASRRVAGAFGNSTTRGFRWNGAVSSIGTFGGDSSIATAINDQGKVVGWAKMSTGASRAFLWQNGTLTNLRTLSGASSKAYGINGLGHIVGESQVAGSRHMHAFLWKDGVMYDLGLGTATAINSNGWIVGTRTDPATYGTTQPLPTLWKPAATPPPIPAAGRVKFGNFWFASVRNGSWNPAVDTVPVGRTVTWESTTARAHTVQSVGSPSFTSSGSLQGIGTRHTFTFRTPGTYQYNCALHPKTMFGQIIVR